MKDLFTSTSCLSQEEIRRYLSKELSDDQRYEVENHMLDCPLCNDAIEGFAAHYNFEEDQQLDQIKEAIQLREQADAAPQSRPVRSLLLNRIAASLLFLVLAAAALVYWQSGHQQRLYQAYYEAPDTDLFAGLRGSAAGEAEGPLAQAMERYQQKAFQQSLPYFEEYLAQSPENATANFLAGTAYLEIGRLAAAKTQFQIARINSETFYEQATWYLALIHIRSAETKEAIPLLEELSGGSPNAYQKKATALLEELKQ